MTISYLIQHSHRMSEDSQPPAVTGVGEEFPDLDMSRRLRREKNHGTMKRFLILLRALSLYHQVVVFLWIKKEVKRLRCWLR